ncbi:MAG: efflux RND transporter periplasmic adaptor subunit [Alphaproteobacteria bacterium]
MKKWAFFILLITITISYLWFFNQPSAQSNEISSGLKDASSKPSVIVSIAPVERKDIPIEIQLAGTVFAYKTIAIKSRLDSQIAAVHFHDGDLVKAGAKLFTLDNRALKATLEQQKANLQKDEAQLISIKSQYERSLELTNKGYTTVAKLEQDKASLDAQTALIAGDKAAIENSNVTLDYMEIRSPITGRAGTINQTTGNNVKANADTPLVTINQVDPILVQFSVPQRYYHLVKNSINDNDVQISVNLPECSHAMIGTLDYIDNNIDTSNGTFVARAKFNNAEEKLWPGMFVNTTIQLGRVKSAIVIPASALQGDEQNRFVFVADLANNKAVKKNVTLDQIINENAIIKDGLSELDFVIMDGLLKVLDGTQIEAKK